MPETSPLIIVASRNQKKIAEINILLEPYQLSVKSVGEFPDAPEVVEDGNSFAENAAKKATTIAKHLDAWAIGEDSGLCVDALKGEPGIYSARFAGENATDDQNNALLLEKLDGVPLAKRSGHYVCHVALSNPAGEIVVSAERECHGLIATDGPRGTNGFGYDPYFLVREYGKTFGELSPVVKKSISHRARAFSQFIPAMIRAVRA